MSGTLSIVTSHSVIPFDLLVSVIKLNSYALHAFRLLYPSFIGVYWKPVACILQRFSVRGEFGTRHPICSLCTRLFTFFFILYFKHRLSSSLNDLFLWVMCRASGTECSGGSREQLWDSTLIVTRNIKWIYVVKHFCSLYATPMLRSFNK